MWSGRRGGRAGHAWWRLPIPECPCYLKRLAQGNNVHHDDHHCRSLHKHRHRHGRHIIIITADRHNRHDQLRENCVVPPDSIVATSP